MLDFCLKSKAQYLNGMRIETEKIQLGPYRIDTIGSDRVLTSQRTGDKFTINPQQIIYLDQMANGVTIEQIALSEMTHSTPFSFRALYALLKDLVLTGVITDYKIRNYFEEILEQENPSAPSPKHLTEPTGNWKPNHIRRLPFFSSLPEELQDAFVANAELIVLPERAKILSAGDRTREMYAILEGTASVYKSSPESGRRKLVTIIHAGSIFGEGAFFLDKPRTADVITNTACVLARIKYDSSSFSSLVSSSKGAIFQQWIWLLHGLIASSIFQDVPADAMDRFALAGRPRNFSAGDIICKQGEPGDSVFMVIQGEAVVLRKDRPIKVLKQGDLFGEIAMLINKGERVASVKAETSGLLLEISKNEFAQVMCQNIVLAKEIEEIAYRRYGDLFN